MRFGTKVIHEGYSPDPQTGAIMPPIYMTSTYQIREPGVSQEYDYTRAGNPNFTILENLLASLEEAKFATVFSAGLGALTALLSLLSSGDKIIALSSLYGGTYRLLTKVFSHYGIELQLIGPEEIHTLEQKDGTGG